MSERETNSLKDDKQMAYEIKKIAPKTSRPESVEFEIVGEHDWAAAVSFVNGNGKMQFDGFSGDNCLVPHAKIVCISNNDVRTFLKWDSSEYVEITEEEAFEIAATMYMAWRIERPRHRLKNGEVIPA